MSALMMKSRALAATRQAVVAKAGKTVSGKKTVSSKAPASDLTEGQQYLLTLPGVTQPFPNVFDPAGFATKAPIREIRRWRESEIMHGRVAMLAAVGFIVGEQLEDFPAFMNFDGSITGPAIYQFQQVRQGFWEPLLICIGLAESYRVSLAWATPTGNGFNSLKDEYNMGELFFDPLNIRPEPGSAEDFELQTKELNNGRLAMISIAGFVLQELVDQKEIFEHLFVEAADELVREIDDLERDVGLPETPIPFPGF